MKLSTEALNHYFRRIGFSGSPRADLSTLQQLHALHPRAIPFENLNSWLGIPVLLEPEALYQKLVLQKRGGYCFEHNLLFMRVLKTLGFTVQGLAARVLWNLPADTVLPRTHMLLLVTLDGMDLIVDVGFGGLTMTAAVQLDTNAVQNSPHEKLRLSQHDDHHVLHVLIAGSWQPLYRFSLEEQQLADYLMANWYVSTHPQSRFVSQLIAARADTGIRHALLDKRYTRHYPDRASEQRDLDSSAAVIEVLKQQFLLDPGALPGLDARLATLFPGT